MINWSPIKIQNFGSSKDTFKRMKRQPTYWKKIFTNLISNKERALCTAYKEFRELSGERYFWYDSISRSADLLSNEIGENYF